MVCTFFLKKMREHQDIIVLYITQLPFFNQAFVILLEK